MERDDVSALAALEGQRVREVPTFEVFYAVRHDAVYRALALTLGDTDLAAEATDEAMVRAYERWATVSTYDNPAGWVYRVGLNWSRSWLRKRRREMHGSHDVAVVAGEPTDPAIAAALATLSVEQRATVVLRLFLDWSTAEVARSLHVSEGTVKSRLSRGLDQMRTALS